jgi:hypothetical protein
VIGGWMDGIAIEATREIMWRIPLWMKIAMYLSLLVANVVLAKGLYEKFKYVTQGKSWKAILPKKLNSKTFSRRFFFKEKLLVILTLEFIIPCYFMDS